MNVEPISAADPDWLAFWRAHSMTSSLVPIWQTLSGWQPHALVLKDNGKIIAGLELLLRRVPYTPIHLSRVVRACVPESPREGAEAFATLLDAIDLYCGENRSIETELQLRLPASAPAPFWQTHRAMQSAAMAAGYFELASEESTYLIDLSVPDDDRLASWSSSARNKVRRAERQGVKVAVSHDPKDLENFTESLLAMTARKNAPDMPESYLVEGLPPLIQAGDCRLYVESYDGVAANIVVVDMRGRPTYALGTRSIDNVRGRVPGAAQALHFAISKELREEGHPVYDLGGCEGPVPAAGHPNYGVWLFKYELLGTYVQLLPPLRKTRAPLGRFIEWVHEVRGDPPVRST